MEYLKIIRITFLEETRVKKSFLGIPLEKEKITVAHVTFSNNDFKKIYTDKHPEWINAREGDFARLIVTGNGYLLIADAYEPQGVYFSLPRDN